MLRIRFVHPSPAPIGCTVERLADGKYLDASAWSAAEPKPTPLARDPAPAQDRARLEVPDDGWAPGDYAVTVWELAADGTAKAIVGYLAYAVPAPPVVPEVRVSLGVAGR